MINSNIRFKNPGKVANRFVDIIAPTFGLSMALKIAVKARLKLAKKEELRQCLTDALKFLAIEYKK